MKTDGTRHAGHNAIPRFRVRVLPRHPGSVVEGVPIMLCSIATKLGESELRDIAALEKELGTTMLAFSCHAVDAASLSDVELERIKALEDRLGVALVAVRQAA